MDPRADVGLRVRNAVWTADEPDQKVHGRHNLLIPSGVGEIPRPCVPECVSRERPLDARTSPDRAAVRTAPTDSHPRGTHVWLVSMSEALNHVESLM